MVTDKKQHWQDVVYSPSGVVAGEYDRPVITINDFGFITEASSSNIPSQTVVQTIGDLAGLTSTVTGDIAIVLNTGGSEEEEMYVWNTTNTDLGSPLGKWRLLATTELAAPPVNYRNENVGNTMISTDLGAPLFPDAKIKAVNVSILSVYDPGITMTIQDKSPTVWMDSSVINTQLVGTYTQDWSDNDAYLLNPQLEAVLSGVSAGGGSALVFVEFINQS